MNIYMCVHLFTHMFTYVYMHRPEKWGQSERTPLQTATARTHRPPPRVNWTYAYCEHLCISAYICRCICVYIWTCVHNHSSVLICIHILYMCIHVCTLRICVYICVHWYTCIHMCTLIRIHINLICTWCAPLCHSIYLNTCKRVYTYSTCKCVYIYVDIYSYVHKYTCIQMNGLTQYT